MNARAGKNKLKAGAGKYTLRDAGRETRIPGIFCLWDFFSSLSIFVFLILLAKYIKFAKYYSKYSNSWIQVIFTINVALDLILTGSISPQIKTMRKQRKQFASVPWNGCPENFPNINWKPSNYRVLFLVKSCNPKIHWKTPAMQSYS